ncbi:hypothetical protein EOA60_20855 [Mesorhizobium sp. M1A.F.Ca.IN.020.06.1.1]|uniref:hypothetical protein n=1 Tax=unclassified Mesorhizobium TaxID=325217 RepID=UPI000FCC5C93|nr:MULTISPECIES: hypothetical protein [unclassified Mesorhizobium]RUV81410.1 hypothetical protein EOA51_31310 [Mesorhizobium sp. M1A.F.Ca.IN.020.32.1.1]RUW06658.1 hypothetical protein EOA46_25575 [Mesorhizobium sp. M1A.F.Ca.IN.022.05.2.1]RUW24394.1 hypothetical protein EOA60_20855 [Mesorhizobium sp. M1A.F.Ca.IN.020.06.1.1]RWF81350.1 MAG: hypothetical protein EOQ35_14420 [Mesorhizobium sp.]RWF93169.1 MAG: hypothetical protein EOQ38_28720 [Mesorhizobium sp.]
MNDAEVRAVPESNGFRGEFKKVHRTDWEPVCENGVAQLFDTEEQAQVAAYRALMKHLFGDGIVRDGEKASAERSKAEALFGGIFRRGRKIEVERR